jgi:hypothetical protein
MPFDCTPVIDPPKQFSLIAGSGVEVRFGSVTAPTTADSLTRYWYMSGEAVATATAVLSKARDLISEERRWCKATLARGWLDVPVPIYSRFARRFCAIGAIYRAGRDLGLPVNDACSALEGQTVRTIPYWNDGRRRTHAEVIAAFDAAIVALL